MIIGTIGLFLANALEDGCTPGPVAARSAVDRTAGVGNLGGSGVRASGRDAATAETDAAGATRGSAGSGGATSVNAGMTPDGTALTDAASPETRTPLDAAAEAPPDTPSARAPGPGEVAIDELLVNPTGDDLGREWVELANRASQPLDLSQLHLATASTDVAAAAGTIAPGTLLLLGQSSDPTKNGGAPVAVAYGTKLILINANGQLSLCLGACASGVVIDTVSWGALSDDDTGHALIVDPAAGGLCVASAPFGTAGSFGTPGEPNPPCGENVDGGSRADVSVAD
jgi:hypothetical protein